MSFSGKVEQMIWRAFLVIDRLHAGQNVHILDNTSTYTEGYWLCHEQIMQVVARFMLDWLW
jgi:hypothetical protein